MDASSKRDAQVGFSMKDDIYFVEDPTEIEHPSTCDVTLGEINEDECEK